MVISCARSILINMLVYSFVSVCINLYVHIFHILDWAHMLRDEISKSATLILVGAYGIMLLDIVVVAVVRAHIILIIMSVRIIVEAK